MLNLSIITPTLNSEATIAETCKSIEQLVNSGAEHIVVDSGSTDSTLDILNNYNCKILYYPKGNMYKAINYGILNSNGRLVTYINSDDLLYSEEILAILDNNDNFDLLYGNINYINESNLYLSSRRAVWPFLLHYSSLYFNPIFQQGLIFTRDLYENLGGFDESYRFSADMDFILKAIYSKCKIQKSNRIIAAFRLSENQLSNKLWDEMKLEGPIIRKKINRKYHIKTYIIIKYLSYLVRVLINLDYILISKLKKK
jgi:glycosyltransferase involved in cell wall biosynthesis